MNRRAELRHDALRLHQHAPEPVDGISIVVAMHVIIRERDRVRHLVRPGDDAYGQIEARQLLLQAAVEGGNRLRLEGEPLDTPVARAGLRAGDR